MIMMSIVSLLLFVLGYVDLSWQLMLRVCDEVYFSVPHSLFVSQGSYGSWKTWKVMEFRKKNSRPGKSWNFDQSHGKSWKIVII